MTTIDKAYRLTSLNTEDIPQLLRIDRASMTRCKHTAKFYREFFRERLRKTTGLEVIRSDGQREIVAHVWSILNPPSVTVVHLAVRPDHQGHGLASFLLFHLSEWAFRKRRFEMLAACVPRMNVAANAFFRRHRFYVDQYQDDHFLYRLDKQIQADDLTTGVQYAWVLHRDVRVGVLDALEWNRAGLIVHCCEGKEEFVWGRDLIRVNRVSIDATC